MRRRSSISDAWLRLKGIFLIRKIWKLMSHELWLTLSQYFRHQNLFSFEKLHVWHFEAPRLRSQFFHSTPFFRSENEKLFRLWKTKNSLITVVNEKIKKIFFGMFCAFYFFYQESSSDVFSRTEIFDFSSSDWSAWVAI